MMVLFPWMSRKNAGTASRDALLGTDWDSYSHGDGTLAYDSTPAAAQSNWVLTFMFLSWTLSLMLVGYIAMLMEGGSKSIEIFSNLPVDALVFYNYTTIDSAIAAIICSAAAVFMTPAGRRVQHVPMVALSVALMGANLLQAFPVHQYFELL